MFALPLPNCLGVKAGLYMEVVLVSLTTEAFHANVISSTIAVGGWDRIDLPTEVDDWIRPSHASGEKDDLQLLKIVQSPGTSCTIPGPAGCGNI